MVKNEDVPRFSGHIYDSAKELYSLIEDIIRLSQLDEGEELPKEPIKLLEIIYNLCDNALKYNVPGGSVKVSVSHNETYAEIDVSDTGIGISPEDRERIFERFYRVDKSHSKSSGGTGLGLSIVKHAVLYHGGKVTVESEPLKGSCFKVVLPLK